MTIGRGYYFQRDYTNATLEFERAKPALDDLWERTRNSEVGVQRLKCMIDLGRTIFSGRKVDEAINYFQSNARFVDEFAQSKPSGSAANELIAEFWVVYADTLVKKGTSLTALKPGLMMANQAYTRNWEVSPTSEYHAEVLVKCLQRLIQATKDAEEPTGELIEKVLVVNKVLEEALQKNPPVVGGSLAMGLARRHQTLAETYGAAGLGELVSKHALESTKLMFEELQRSDDFKKEIRGRLEGLAKVLADLGQVTTAVLVTQKWETIAVTPEGKPDAGAWWHISRIYTRCASVLQKRAEKTALSEQEKEQLKQLRLDALRAVTQVGTGKLAKPSSNQPIP
jgi:hypothetical protein